MSYIISSKIKILPIISSLCLTVFACQGKSSDSKPGPPAIQEQGHVVDPGHDDHHGQTSTSLSASINILETKATLTNAKIAIAEVTITTKNKGIYAYASSPTPSDSCNISMERNGSDLNWTVYAKASNNSSKVTLCKRPIVISSQTPEEVITADLSFENVTSSNDTTPITPVGGRCVGNDPPMYCMYKFLAETCAGVPGCYWVTDSTKSNTGEFCEGGVSRECKTIHNQLDCSNYSICTWQ